MDLTPRDDIEQPVKKRNSRRWAPIAVVVVAVIAGGFVVTQFLTNAIDYYCNVDEIGARSGCEEDRRLRVQGVVVEDSLRKESGVTVFELSFNETVLPVNYFGDPGGIFQECIPVVAHGRMNNGVFDSNRIEVKHSNEYQSKNELRLDEADEQAAACVAQKG
jgi:cytochrome c-type biogenesis protein CcmE